jgi:hypothetical protein
MHHAKVYNELYANSDLHMRKKEWSVQVCGVSVVDVVCGVYGACGECVVSVQFVWCVR